MNGPDLTRRAMVTGSIASAGAVLTAGQPGHAATPPAADGAIAAVVMRVPVLVPPTADALSDIRTRNLQAMLAALEDTMKGPGPKPRLIVFPVLQHVSSKRSVSGVPMSAVAVDLTSEPLDRGVFGPIVAACRRHDCFVATSTQEKTPRLPGRFFHTGFIMGPDGLVLRSPKAQAQSAPDVSYLRDIPDEYVRAFGPDSILPVARTPIGVLGCYIAGEAEVFEASRLLAGKGAQIIVHPSLEDDERPWLALKQALAFQCQVFLLTGATSRNIEPNDPAGGWCGGAATIVGPDGKVLASLGGRDEGAAKAVVDLAAIDAAKARRARETTPAWGLYRKFYGEALDGAARP